jgi:prephenate dehydrogenase
MKALDEAEFSIVGTGLMGSSLALALRDKVKTLYGVDRDAETRALAAPYFDRISDDLPTIAATSDVIVLATPVRTILQLLNVVKMCAKPGTLIMDIGSSKAQIVEAMNKLPEHLLAVAGHPMCGKETSGPADADETLFWDRAFILCPTARSTPEALQFAKAMVDAIGARSLTLPAERHDRAVAAISHVPYALSVALVEMVVSETQHDPTAWDLASSGFRDTSRLAGSDITMMGDTLLTNRDAVLSTFASFRQQLNRIESALQANNQAELRAILEDGKKSQAAWFKKFMSSSE